MFRRPPLACPRCASERSRESSYGARLCDACGIEFRPRERVPIRSATPGDPWMLGLAGMIVVAAAIGGIGYMFDAFESPNTEFPPPAEPIVIQPVELSPIYDADFIMLRPQEPPSVDVVTHRLERREGRVEATGLLAVSTRTVARPQVHVGFFDAQGEAIGAVLAHVACSKIDTTPCPWGFAGSEPPRTAEVRIRASGENDIGDLHRVARLRFAFDDEFEPTNLECNPPDFEASEAELIPRKRGRELEVRVGMPEELRLRNARATLVGYAEGSRVELVLPFPSPVGLARRVELPEHEHAIVRWQLWIDGPIADW